MEQAKGPSFVLGPEEGDSWWQPAPAFGHATVKLSPRNAPMNGFAMGVQEIAPGGRLAAHAHGRNEELLFVYEGEGTAIVDGVRHAVRQGSTIFAGRWVTHSIENPGPGPLRLMWIIFPPGLEDVLAGLGQPRRPGEARPAKADARPENAREILDRGHFAKPEQLTT